MATAAAAILTAIGSAVKAVTALVLNYFGFTSVGPAAGSFAAAWMASLGSAGVAAGSFYAACQSAAMGGGALFGLPVLVGIGAISAAGYACLKFFRGA